MGAIAGWHTAPGGGCETESAKAAALLGRQLRRLDERTQDAADRERLERLAATLGIARGALCVLARIETAEGETRA